LAFLSEIQAGSTVPWTRIPAHGATARPGHTSTSSPRRTKTPVTIARAAVAPAAAGVGWLEGAGCASPLVAEAFSGVLGSGAGARAAQPMVAKANSTKLDVRMALIRRT